MMYKLFINYYGRFFIIIFNKVNKFFNEDGLYNEVQHLKK